MVGSGVLNWPTDRDEFLAMRLGLFREFASQGIDVLDFGMHFFYAGSSRYDDTLNEISTQLFQPTVRDFRKHLEKVVRDLDAGELSLAADRIVKRSDNSEKFDEVIEASDEVVKALRENNSYENAVEKERLIAEIVSGTYLLRAAEVRIEAIKATIWAALKYLSKKVWDNALNVLIATAFLYVSQLIGL